MNKKDFIQRALIGWVALYPNDDNKVIDRAEKAWQTLSERGYGESQKKGAQELKTGHYAALNAQQKEWFDKFWTAFKYTSGKEGAAMRWNQIYPDEQLAHKIIKAAGKEAGKDHGTTTRKMAQGWLNEGRYNDYDDTHKEQIIQVTNNLQKKNDLYADIKNLKYMLSVTQVEETKESLKAQIEKKEKELKELVK